MEKKNVLILSGILGVLLGAILLGLSLWKVPEQQAQKSDCPDFTEGEITIADKTVEVSIADTPTQQARGLGGCPEIPQDSGMLFPYSPAQAASFWMKDMLIPLDIVWIAQGKVVGIEKNVPAPAPRTLDNALPVYRSPGTVDNVLELKAGGAEEYGIAVGSEVNL